MKRTFWTTVGYTLGAGTGWYVQRRVKRTVDRYAPEHVRADMAHRGRQVTSRARGAMVDLRDAASEGISAMRAERADLLAEFASDDPSRTGSARAVRPHQGEQLGYRPRHR